MTDVAVLRAWDGGPAPVPLSPAPFPGARFRGCVDIVMAGFPCPPVSTAGKRRGTDDARWLWGSIARLLLEVQPGFVFLENVSGLLSANDGRAFGLILGDLAAIGDDAEW